MYPPNSYRVAARLAGHTDDAEMARMRGALVKALERIAELEAFIEMPAYGHSDK